MKITLSPLITEKQQVLIDNLLESTPEKLKKEDITDLVCI